VRHFIRPVKVEIQVSLGGSHHKVSFGCGKESKQKEG